MLSTRAILLSQDRQHDLNKAADEVKSSEEKAAAEKAAAKEKVASRRTRSPNRGVPSLLSSSDSR